MFFRRRGFRTAAEIDQERYALKALRGDFRHLPAFTTIDNREAIARFDGEGGTVDGPEVPEVTSQSATHQALEAVRTFKPLSPAQLSALVAKT